MMPAHSILDEFAGHGAFAVVREIGDSIGGFGGDEALPICCRVTRFPFSGGDRRLACGTGWQVLGMFDLAVTPGGWTRGERSRTRRRVNGPMMSGGVMRPTPERYAFEPHRVHDVFGVGGFRLRSVVGAGIFRRRGSAAAWSD